MHQLEAELKTLKRAVISKQTSSVGTVRARQLLYSQEVKLRNEAAAEAKGEAPYPEPKRQLTSSKHFLDQVLERE